MQITKAEKTRLGIFIILTLATLAAVLFYMLGRHLIKKEDSYFVKYSESVDGLLPAASVKLNGVVVGRVREMYVDSADIRKIIVHFSVKHGTPLKANMIANLAGGLTITGLKTIEISGGSNDAPNLPLGGEIQAGVSQMKMLTGQAETIALKFETLLNNMLNLTNEENQILASRFLKHMYNISMEADTLIKKNKTILGNIPTQTAQALSHLQSTAAKAEIVLKDIQAAKPGIKLGKTMDEFQAVAKELHAKVKKAEVQKTMHEFQKTAKGVTAVTVKLERTLAIIQDDLGSIMEHIKESSENIEDFSRMIKENPSLLLRPEDKKERGL